ncbi:MAG: S8 family serine peptidase, partial [Clostridia bacterium]|nr:S8 family serine peptidase [Clostridia bacterium]
MKRTIRTTAILFLVAACVLFVFSGFFVNTTYAVLPAEYESEVAGNDWYFGENFLNLASLKTTVASWFEDDRVYDFAAIERDPIVVAVIDSGINYNHQLFTGKYDENGVAVETSDAGEYDVLLRDAEGNLICKNTVVGKNYEEDDVMDDAPDRHGTHVAGIVATLIHELNLEKYIKILPIKAAYPVDKDDESKGSSFSVAAINAAIEFALDNGADVVNMSLTSKNANDSDFEKLVTNSMAEEAVFVGAAGNNGKCSSINIFGNKVNYYYPAASSNVIGVMALTHNEDVNKYVVYSHSNYGEAYDLAAPGAGNDSEGKSDFIWSADGKTNNGYKPLKGTSMATPIVSFGAALATLKYAAIAAATGEVNAKTPREIANIIKSSYSGTLTYNKTSLRVFDMNVFAAAEGMYSLYIDCDEASLHQTQGDVKAVNFSAMLLPINYDNDVYSNNIRWYVQIGEEETELGVGKN